MRHLSVVALLLLGLTAASAQKKGAAPPAPPPPPPPPPMATVTQQLTCEAGYELRGTLCVQEVVANEEETCRNGILSGKDGCQLTTPKVPQCPAGTVDRNGECLVLSDSEPEYFCPIGFTDNGKDCAGSIASVPEQVCNRGTLQGNNCIVTTDTPYEYTWHCPQGTQPDKDGCWLILDSFDCSPPPRKGKPTPPTKKSSAVITAPSAPSSKKKKHLRYLAGKEDELDQLLAEEAQESLAPVTPPRPTQTTVVQQMCVKRENVPMEKQQTCPAGATDTGTGCSLTEIFPITNRCANGSKGKECAPIITYRPKVARCKDGSTPNEQNRCPLQSAVPPNAVCPLGYTDEGTICVQYLPSKRACPPGFTQNGKGQCTAKKIVPPTAITVQSKASYAPVVSKK